MTTSEIAAEHGVSRQTVHAHRKRGAFPNPVEGEGSTRPRFRADEVAAFFAANPPTPGKRTDLPAKQQGNPVKSAAKPDAAPDPAALFQAIRDRWGDHVLKRFEDVEEVVEEQFPGFFDLPLPERSALIGALYAEAWRREE